MNHWLAVSLIAMYALSSIVTITQIGKPRKPLDSSSAAVIVVINSLIVTAIVIAAFR